MAARHLELPCGTTLSEEVGNFVGHLGHEADLPGSRAYWLRLAVDEITTNIADHGYHGGAGVIDLESGIEAGQVWVRIRDDSPPFDPRSHDASGLLQESPAEREQGGYGLLLALAKLDGFDYLREGGRNCTYLSINRSDVDDTDDSDDSDDSDGDDGDDGGTEHDPSNARDSAEGSRPWTARGH